MQNLLNPFLSVLIIGTLLFSSCESYEFEEPGLLVPLTVVEDSSLPSISVNGTLLHSETFGNPENPMLMVIHGGPGADYRSNLNYKDLADDGMYVVFYDQRGSGLSQRHDASFYEAMNVQMFIDDLAAVIEHYRTGPDHKLILAGHSWGAMLATAYIDQNPSKVDGAILAEPGGFVWEDTEAYIMRSLSLEVFSESTNDAVYKDQFITGDDHETLDYKLGLFSGSVETGDIGLPPFWRLGGVMSNWSQNYAIENPDEMDFTKNLTQYSKTVLFAYSENNVHYGLKHAELVSSAYPNVSLTEVANCGHEIIHFGWEAFYPIVLDYINENI